MRSAPLLAALSICAVIACSSPPPTPQQAAAAEPVVKADPEQQLRKEVGTWKGTPYVDGGTTHKGVGNAAFVRAAYESAFSIAIPASYDEQIHSGKLVERDKLQPGDLVFFDGQGFGPFKSHWVGLYAGHGDVAIAKKDLGISVVHLADAPWTTMFKTARRMPTDPNAAPPSFDRSKYGSNTAALLRDIAQAWSGTLYKQGGTTFDGIGNAEFVRSVWGAVNEAILEGTPDNWATLGDSVPKDKLQPGDVILYGGGSVSGRSAGIYIGDGDFVHAVRGSAVTISQIDDPHWKPEYKDARRIDPDALTRMEEAAAARKAAAATPAPKPAATTASAAPAHGAKPSKPAASTTPPPEPPKPVSTEPAAPPTLPPGTPRPISDNERKLRDATEEWRGTPYKLGGTTKAGVDCSAFVRAIYLEVFKYELPRTAEEQETLGKEVERNTLETGDLVFFRTQGMGPFFKSRHVGLYLGNGEFAQASGRKGVTISRLDDYYWSQKYSSARRLPAAASPVAGSQ